MIDTGIAFPPREEHVARIITTLESRRRYLVLWRESLASGSTDTMLVWCTKRNTSFSMYQWLLQETGEDPRPCKQTNFGVM